MRDPGRFVTSGFRIRPAASALVGALWSLGSAGGCNSILNSWLDPTTLGKFDRTATNEIRASLTLEDAPSAIPGATPPTLEDLEVKVYEFPISAGDSLAVEINELRQRQTAFQTQVQVATAGYVNIPVVGRVMAAGLTVPEFEAALAQALRDRNVLLDPEVTVNPLYLQKATYSIFGVGVSASSDSPLRAGTFPIRRPDLRLLEAINHVGGLNEFVTEVYIFRLDKLYAQPAAPGPPGRPTSSREGNRGIPSEAVPTRPASPARPDDPGPDASRQALIDLVERPKEPAPPRAEEEVEDIPEGLEPDPLQPYIFVNGEFVPNPAYTGPRRDVRGEVAEVTMTESTTPAINWARIAGDSNFRIIVVPAESLRGGDPMADVVVRAGDVIRISSGEVGVYYVMGQVNRVGAFRFDLEQVTLKSAIAVAGGLSSLAWPDRCTVYRRLGRREQMIQVNLDRIYAGLDSDFTIKRGDIINVGTHPFAPFLERIRGLTLPNPVANVGYSFTYARNFADIDSFAVQSNPRNEPDQFPQLFP
jgi:protein involved in polysaccharide export with SLBB domain